MNLDTKPMVTLLRILAVCGGIGFVMAWLLPWKIALAISVSLLALLIVYRMFTNR